MTLSNTLMAALLCQLLALGCLPTDTRPPPAKVLVDVELPGDLSLTPTDPNQPEKTSISFDTDDGWSVSVDRLTVSLGLVEVFADENCSAYAHAPYFRILELTQAGPHRLAQIWGWGSCKVDYSVEIPPVDALRGAGVSEQDAAFQRTALVPVSTPDGPGTAEGMTLWIRGRATRDAVSVSFDWGFADRLQWSECQRVIDDRVESGLPLESDATVSVSIALDPRNLFKLGTKSLVQLIVDADQTHGNADGTVTLTELTATSVPSNELNLAEVLRQNGYPSLFVYGERNQCKLNDPEF